MLFLRVCVCFLPMKDFCSLLKIHPSTLAAESGSACNYFLIISLILQVNLAPFKAVKSFYLVIVCYFSLLFLDNIRWLIDVPRLYYETDILISWDPRKWLWSPFVHTWIQHSRWLSERISSSDQEGQLDYPQRLKHFFLIRCASDSFTRFWMHWI